MKIINRIQNLSRLARQEFFNLRSDFARDDSFLDLDSTERQIVQNIQRDGYAVIPDFFNADQCQRWVREIDRLLALKDVQVTADEHRSDLRIYGANCVSTELQEYFSNDQIRGMIEGYEKHAITDGFTLAARLHSVEGNLGSGGGWHRDSASIRQTKAIVYLTDVGADQGPFQYLKRSHKSISVIKDQLKYDRSFNQHRFSNEDIEQLLATNAFELNTLEAKAGTVIIADTRGIHRGKPIEHSTRYALTNYLWFSTKMPDHLQRLVSDNSQSTA